MVNEAAAARLDPPRERFGLGLFEAAVAGRDEHDFLAPQLVPPPGRNMVQFHGRGAGDRDERHAL